MIEGLLRALHLGFERYGGREATPEFSALREFYESGWSDIRCLFVLSTGRTGTTTLARLLDTSPELESYHEPVPSLAHVSLLAHRAGDDQLTEPDRWDAIVDAGRAEYVARAANAGRIYAETNNRLAYLAPSLSRFFPASKFVFLHRHPYDVIRSGRSRGWYEGNAWDWCRIRPLSGDPYFDEWEGMHPTQRIAWLWRTTNEFVQESLNHLSPERWIEVRSADLFRKGISTTNRILRLVEVPNIDARGARTILGRKLNAGDIEGFEVQDDLIPSIRRIVGPLGEKLGYRL